MNSEALARIRQNRAVFILRSNQSVDLEGWIRTAVENGARCLEITLPTPGALPAIARARRQYPNLLIGGGTVLTTDEVAALSDAGAEFAVSPHFDPAIVDACRKRGLACIPGVCTPTEMVAAWRAGATALKLFPAPASEVVRALRAPLPELPLVAVGGVSRENLRGFLDAGCVAVGVGGSVFAVKLTLAEIGHRVAELVQLAQSAPPT